MMTRPQIIFPVLVLLLFASAGNSYAQNVDCRSCHVKGSKSGAADFSAVYANAASHHPVDINYPLSLDAQMYFHQPDMQHDDVTFFDKNDNGQPDSNEIQLFGRNGTAKITCSTCHRDHGTKPLAANAPRDAYLRVTVEGSVLCSNCHNK
jgi:cytochrome c553